MAFISWIERLLTSIIKDEPTIAVIISLLLTIGILLYMINRLRSDLRECLEKRDNDAEHLRNLKENDKQELMDIIQKYHDSQYDLKDAYRDIEKLLIRIDQNLNNKS